MTGKDLKIVLKSLRWSQAELGRRVEMAPHSVSRWVNEDEVPGPVSAYVLLALKVKKLSMVVTGGGSK